MFTSCSSACALVARLRQTWKLGDRKRGRDGTRYSRVCNSISYLTHHMRQISGAAVMTDAANIEKEIIKLKITHASRAQ